MKSPYRPIVPSRPFPPSFELCELRGGPWHRQHVYIPAGQDTLRIRQQSTPHVYHRLSLARVLHHEVKVAAMFRGKR